MTALRWDWLRRHWKERETTWRRPINPSRQLEALRRPKPKQPEDPPPPKDKQ